MLAAKARPAAFAELEALTTFAKSRGFEGESLSLWDVPFWSERQSEEIFGFEEEELRPYFALPNVLDGLFALNKRLFGIDIVEATTDAPLWHPDVQFFHVFDESSKAHIVSFYLDPYARPENKRGGAWMDVCVGKSSVLGRIPVAYLTCNGSPPIDGKPSLMTFSDEATLFGMAKHYETGVPLPRELFEKLCEQKTYQAGMTMVRQLYFGALDMALHHKYDATTSQTPFELQQDLAKKFSVIPPLPEDRFLCGFGHIFAGGYAAGYYSYKWAEVLSADAFAAFEEVGLDNEEAVREVGRRFRSTVLSLGGGTHPSEVFRAFRGRDPSPEPLLRHSGLVD